MDDNKDIEKVSKAVFNDHLMEPPASAWSKLEGDLNKKQALAYQYKANRFKLLSLVLSLLLCCIATCHFITPTKTIYQNSNNQVPTAKTDIPTEVAQKLEFNETNPPSLNSRSNSTIKTESTKSIRNFTNNDKKNSVTNSQSTIAINSIDQQIHAAAFSATNHSIAFDNLVIDTNKLASSLATTISPTSIDTFITDESQSSSNFRLTENSALNIEQPKDSLPIDSISAPNINPTVQNTEPYKYSLSLYFAQGVSMDYLKDKTNNQFNEVKMYKDREKAEYSFIAGINFLYNLNSNWSVGSGVSYSSLVKSMHVPFMYAEANNENQYHFMYTTSSGTIELPNDGGHLQANEGDTLWENSKCKQEIRFINLPIQLRYQFSKNKFTWYTSTGVTVNFVIQEKAKIAMQTSEITVTNNVKGLKKANLGYQIGFGVSYALKKSLDIYLEPTIRGSLNSITENMPVNSYPHFIGISTGLTFKF
ncbi:MAG: outer membrane beta-barrel protein [Bacteroidetes bacterium]|nr:outer membrane beta-barrel protein [Bacteroidota bacterium]